MAILREGKRKKMKKTLTILGIWILCFSSSLWLSGGIEDRQTFVSGENGRAGTEDLLKKMRPVLYVESIEPSLGFWVDALGFVKTVGVPEDNKLGFVILTSGNTEIMLQSYASLNKDIPKLGEEMCGVPSVLYIEVEDIAEIERRLEEYKVVVPKRWTFYGSTEIFYRSPGGHVVGFAEQAPD
jgi:hypothetical protein